MFCKMPIQDLKHTRRTRYDFILTSRSFFSLSTNSHSLPYILKVCQIQNCCLPTHWKPKTSGNW